MSALSTTCIFLKTLIFVFLMILLSIAPPLYARFLLDPSRRVVSPLSIPSTTSIAFGTSLFILSWGGFFILYSSLPPRPTFFLFQSSSFDPIFSWFYYLLKTSNPEMQGIIRRALLISFFLLGYYTWFLLCCYLAHLLEGDKKERWLDLPPNKLKPTRWQALGARTYSGWRAVAVPRGDEELEPEDLEKGSDSDLSLQFESTDRDLASSSYSGSDGSIVTLSSDSPPIV